MNRPTRRSLRVSVRSSCSPVGLVDHQGVPGELVATLERLRRREELAQHVGLAQEIH
jgi:hypothetical protein